MKKGIILNDLVILLSIGAMYIILMCIGNMDISTYISIGVLSGLACIVLVAHFLGIRKVYNIIQALKISRAKILDLHIKKADLVWDEIKGEAFLFKNQILDREYNSYKKEMSRLKQEGLIYCQADISDYINEKNLYIAIKKRILDGVSVTLLMIGLIGVCVSLICNIDSLEYNFTKDIIMSCIKAIALIGFVTFVCVGEYMIIYRLAMNNLSKECNMFIEDFYKYVIPQVKNDTINNVLYVQQMQMQANQKFTENAVWMITDKLNELLANQNESEMRFYEKIDRMTNSVNRITDSIDKFFREYIKDREKHIERISDVKKEDVINIVNNEENKIRELSEIADRRITEAAKKLAEVEPVVKKRGRKSKAEKEAELQAALEFAKKSQLKKVTPLSTCSM